MGRPAKNPAEFRREAIALVKNSGRPVAEVARSLEIAEGTLWNWVKADREAAERASDPNALSESERDELKRLRVRSPCRGHDDHLDHPARGIHATNGPDVGRGDSRSRMNRTIGQCRPVESPASGVR